MDDAIEDTSQAGTHEATPTQILKNWGNERLRAVLKLNGVTYSGTKTELVERVLANATHGALGLCPTCQHGRLKWTLSNAPPRPSCPGYKEWWGSGQMIRCSGPTGIVETALWKWGNNEEVVPPQAQVRRPSASANTAIATAYSPTSTALGRRLRPRGSAANASPKSSPTVATPKRARAVASAGSPPQRSPANSASSQRSAPPVEAVAAVAEPAEAKAVSGFFAQATDKVRAAREELPPPKRPRWRVVAPLTSPPEPRERPPAPPPTVVKREGTADARDSGPGSSKRRAPSARAPAGAALAGSNPAAAASCLHPVRTADARDRGPGASKQRAPSAMMPAGAALPRVRTRHRLVGLRLRSRIAAQKKLKKQTGPTFPAKAVKRALTAASKFLVAKGHFDTGACLKWGAGNVTDIQADLEHYIMRIAHEHDATGDAEAVRISDNDVLKAASIVCGSSVDAAAAGCNDLGCGWPSLSGLLPTVQLRRVFTKNTSILAPSFAPGALEFLQRLVFRRLLTFASNALSTYSGRKLLPEGAARLIMENSWGHKIAGR